MAEPYWRAGAPERRRPCPRSVGFAEDRRRLRIGLVNNLPDGALLAAERQFAALLQAAAPTRRIELALFHLPGAPRGEAARARLDALYRPAEALADANLDALVVTGAEPRAQDLSAEPFWDGFTRLVDWVDGAGVPALWSCLAAHAAVLHSDGVMRRRLPEKCSGLYRCRAAAPDPLLAGLDGAWTTPHSRWNTLDEAALAACGYRVLSRTQTAGVDAFARGREIFLQGHPEYEPASLPLEFRRDFQRYLDGQADHPPTLPKGVFAPETARQLQALAAEARATRRPDLMALWPQAPGHPDNTWRAPAALLCRNWLAAGCGEATCRPSAMAAVRPRA